MTSQLILPNVFLAMVLITVAEAKWMSEIPNAPARGVSKLFGIPTWIAHIEDYDEDAFNATTVFSAVTMGVSLLYSLYHIVFVYFPTLPRTKRSIGPFNTLILLYLIASFFATLSFAIMNVGRVWASFGVFHNLFEIALLSHIMVRKESLLERSFVSSCFLYLLSTMFIVIISPWPLDALFFKFQGLATDFALTIDLYRLYAHNKRIHQIASVGILDSSNNPPVEDEYSSNDEYRKECAQLVRQLQQQNKDLLDQIDVDPKKAKKKIMVPVHQNIYVLFVAALLHSGGNALVTFSNHFYFWIIFQFIYAIAFPMYAYYCVAEPNASRISFYKVDYAKEALVMVAGVTIAGVSIAVGVYNAEIHY